MIPTVQTIPELLQQTAAPSPANRQPIRLLACGVPDGVESVIMRLYLQGFSQVYEWSPPLPSPIQGEVIRILTRYYQG
ncbi:MAG: hypothetical protein F6K04_12640 [Leptolyngbya sp. SIO4C5]|uniref:hypothetical protein n=1 Tax=Sphaerothrix gracilis TaxID=3151835 RepID=UPI0013BEBBC1|nr:hypothetical protein [Leptolyngbya sp. SIO4C5]